MKKKISCMGIVLLNEPSQEPQVLIMENDLEWVFPKGHVMENEDYISAACREIKEETNVMVSANDCKGQIDQFSFYFEGENAEKVIYVFLFLLNQYQPIVPNYEEGFTQGVWLKANDALAQLSHDDARQSLAKALAYLKK